MKEVHLKKDEEKSETPSWMAPAKSDEITKPPPGADNNTGTVEESEKISVAEKSLLQKVIRKGLVENRHDLEVQRKDPNSPLFSVKSFEALNL